jgi:hypothetical protein
MSHDRPGAPAAESCRLDFGIKMRLLVWDTGDYIFELEQRGRQRGLLKDRR